MSGWFRGSYIGLALTAVVCAAALVIVLHHRSGGTASVRPSGTPTGSASATASPTTGNFKPPAANIAELNQRVKKFSALYFSASTETDVVKLKQQIAPYTTASFLSSATFGFSTNDAADQAMIKEGASLKVTASDLIGDFTSPDKATGVTTLTLTKLDRNGNVVNTVTIAEPMTWVKQNNIWLVQEAPHT